MTIFDSIWNKNKGLPKGNLTTLSDERALLSKIDTTLQLKDIFYEKQPGKYMGGTLSFLIKKDDKDITLKIVNRGVSEEENFWIAMNYVKYKSDTSYHYQEALDLISSREDMQEEVAKLFLMR